MQANFKRMQRTLDKLFSTPCPSQTQIDHAEDNLNLTADKAQLRHVHTYLGLKDGESVINRDEHPIYGADCCSSESSRATVFPHGARDSGDLAALVVAESMLTMRWLVRFTDF